MKRQSRKMALLLSAEFSTKTLVKGMKSDTAANEALTERRKES
jgi:hypothetical protein